MSKKRRQNEQPETPSLAYRMGTQFTIALAVVITDFGLAMMARGGVETTWKDLVGLAVHGLAIGVVVFVWLPLAALLAARTPLSGGAAEGVMVLLLGLLVAGVEFGILRGVERSAHTTAALIGMLAGWAMRIPPPSQRR